jgi:hypothetical protein
VANSKWLYYFYKKTKYDHTGGKEFAKKGTGFY